MSWPWSLSWVWVTQTTEYQERSNSFSFMILYRFIFLFCLLNDYSSPLGAVTDVSYSASCLWYWSHGNYSKGLTAAFLTVRFLDFSFSHWTLDHNASLIVNVDFHTQRSTFHLNSCLISVFCQWSFSEDGRENVLVRRWEFFEKKYMFVRLKSGTMDLRQNLSQINQRRGWIIYERLFQWRWQYGESSQSPWKVCSDPHHQLADYIGTWSRRLAASVL